MGSIEFGKEKLETIRIQNMYEKCKNIIKGYLTDKDFTIKEKLTASQNNLARNDKLQNNEEMKKQINDRLEVLKTKNEINEIIQYLDNATLTIGKLDKKHSLGDGLMVNILNDEDYRVEENKKYGEQENKKTTFGLYKQFSETILLPISIDENTFLHELIHALTFKFDLFGLNQIGMDSEKIKKIQVHMYGEEPDYNSDLEDRQPIIHSYQEEKELLLYNNSLFASDDASVFGKLVENHLIAKDQSFENFLTKISQGLQINESGKEIIKENWKGLQDLKNNDRNRAYKAIKDIIGRKIIADNNKKIGEIDNTIRIYQMIDLEPGHGYMSAFEISARIRELRLDLLREGIITKPGEKITIEKIEKLLVFYGASYEINKSYDILDNIALDKSGRIATTEDREYVKLIIGMNNDEIVQHTVGDTNPYIA